MPEPVFANFFAHPIQLFALLLLATTLCVGFLFSGLCSSRVTPLFERTEASTAAGGCDIKSGDNAMIFKLILPKNSAKIALFVHNMYCKFLKKN
jgi:hypothetical protein